MVRKNDNDLQRTMTAAVILAELAIVVCFVRVSPQVCAKPQHVQGGRDRRRQPRPAHRKVQVLPVSNQLRYPDVKTPANIRTHGSQQHSACWLETSHCACACLCVRPLTEGSGSGNLSTSSSCSETYTSFSDIKP